MYNKVLPVTGAGVATIIGLQVPLFGLIILGAVLCVTGGCLAFRRHTRPNRITP
jgi:hypothetical protein